MLIKQSQMKANLQKKINHRSHNPNRKANNRNRSDTIAFASVSLLPFRNGYAQFFSQKPMTMGTSKLSIV